jgi:hypothetical protein
LNGPDSILVRKILIVGRLIFEDEHDDEHEDECSRLALDVFRSRRSQRYRPRGCRSVSWRVEQDGQPSG